MLKCDCNWTELRVIFAESMYAVWNRPLLCLLNTSCICRVEAVRGDAGVAAVCVYWFGSRFTFKIYLKRLDSHNNRAISAYGSVYFCALPLFLSCFLFSLSLAFSVSACVFVQLPGSPWSHYCSVKLFFLALCRSCECALWSAKRHFILYRGSRAKRSQWLRKKLLINS